LFSPISSLNNPCCIVFKVNMGWLWSLFRSFYKINLFLILSFNIFFNWFSCFFFHFFVRLSQSYVHDLEVSELTRVDLNFFFLIAFYFKLIFFSFIAEIFLLRIWFHCFLGLPYMRSVPTLWPRSWVSNVNTSWFWSSYVFFSNWFFNFIL
jgi:hypothetical protein